MITRYSLLIAILFCLGRPAAVAQCALTIDAGTDLTVCGADAVQLDASVTGTVLQARWSPEAGMDSPISLRPIIAEPVDETYRLTVQAFDETQNLLVNGDFEQGDTGFTSQYESDSNKPGGYIIGKLGTELFPEAKACEDRTTGTGNMMMVKVSDSDNLKIWCQEVTVTPQRDYHFAAYATGLRINNPPIILLSINDLRLSSGTLGSFACSWQRVRGDWNAGNTTTAEICLSVSDDDIGAQTDFALDDMGFYEVCELEDEVSVSVIPLEVRTAAPTVELPCGEGVRLLAEVNAGGRNYTFEWTTDEGNILEDEQSLSPLIDAPGEYRLEVSLPDAPVDCREEIRILVEEVSATPLSISGPMVLHCQQAEVELIAEHPAIQSDIIYQWFDPSGAPLPGAAAATLTVDRPGTYALVLTELVSGCTTTARAEVRESRMETFSFGLDPPNCDRPTGEVFFEKVEGGTPPYLYSIDGGTAFSPEATFRSLLPGGYELVVQDSYGCELREAVQLPPVIRPQIELPSRVLLDPGTAYRIPAVVNLPDTEIAGLAWSPSEGLSCADCLQPEVLTSEPRRYVLEVVSVDSCRAVAGIQVDLREDSDLYVPTAFSPNEDGVNDRLVIYADNDIIAGVSSCRIFDRYGNLVFQRDDLPVNEPAAGWDGQNRGRALPAGVYIYWIELEYMDGRDGFRSGEVLLVR